MKKSNKFSSEVCERAVRMVHEHRGEYPSLWAATESIASKIGCVAQTLNEWVKRVEADTGQRDGVTIAEAQRVKEREREVKELRRANEILKLASAPLTTLRLPPKAGRGLWDYVDSYLWRDSEVGSHTYTGLIPRINTQL